jgi:hypothetical protein
MRQADEVRGAEGVKDRKRLDSAEEAWGRASRDPDGSMTWGSVGRGDEAFWGTLARGWVGWAALALAVGGIVALLVWLL